MTILRLMLKRVLSLFLFLTNYYLTVFTILIGESEKIKNGDQITIVSYGSTLRLVEKAAIELEDLGVSCEIIDVQCLIPFDNSNLIIESLKKTNKLFYDNNMGKISWFKDYLNYNNSIDFSIKKVGSKENNHKFLIKNKIKVLVWFDNGWGYSARIIDTINKLSEGGLNE